MFYVVLVVVSVLIYVVYVAYRRILNPVGETPIDIKRFPRKFGSAAIDLDYYDVVIVGGGPAGATTGYYLAKAGKKVLILEKKKFPRDKICGDAVTKTSIEILMEMGIYGDLIRANKALVADYGGLVSPCGLSYIGHSHEELGEIPAAIACKRIVLDEAIARAAQSAGANLKEASPVKDAVLDKEAGLWTVTVEENDITYRGRVLICADGAPSKLATSLGIVTQPPQGSCSRAYIKEGTHKFKADGVVFYVAGLLPGYAALFKNVHGELNFCCYIIPGNPKVTDSDLPMWHNHLLKENPHISKAVGNTATIERMKAASLRFGGEPFSYGDHVLLIGDAAGMIDPMTGEGIHTAMDGGRIAANFLVEAFEVGNFDKQLMKEYQNRWMKAFGNDFKWSYTLCQLVYRYPILLDAATAAIVRKGDRFLAQWADIMCSRVPKVYLLRPQFIITITFELVLLVLKRLTGQSNKNKKQ